MQCSAIDQCIALVQGMLDSEDIITMEPINSEENSWTGVTPDDQPDNGAWTPTSEATSKASVHRTDLPAIPLLGSDQRRALGGTGGELGGASAPPKKPIAPP
ncbi:uncharacterized protein LOC144464600 [Epinephelus lanceolatus]